MFKFAIPVLHVADSRRAEKFYCESLGFRQDFAYRPFDGDDQCYMGLVRDDVELHVSSFPGDAVSGGVVFIGVEDVDALHAELVKNGVAIALPPTDQSWDNREMYVNDPDNNSIRFVHRPKS
jgi:catechol 2,3-dioxygenase-like lactoylglutathione lyase family enzyme